MDPFRQRLAQKTTLLADGAMGTQLYERLGYRYTCFEELNSSAPEVVRSVHRDYIAAGAEMIETNTFGCNRFVLSQYGLENQVEYLARQGVRLGREAQESMGARVFVAGAVGPLSSRAIAASPAEIRAAFQETVDGLLAGGVDLLILETFGSLAEILAALAVCKASSDIPVIASMTFAEDGQTLSGEAAEDVARALADAGADVVGANCGFGPQPTLDVLRNIAAEIDGPLAALPNAGLPARIEGRLVYTASPEYFATYSERLVSAGIQIIGGCCGTTPAHIAAMRTALNRLQPAAAPESSTPSIEVTWRPAAPPQNGHEETRGEFAEALATGGFPINVEMRPSRGANPAKVLSSAEELREAGIRCVDVTDSAMARVRMNPFVTAHLIQSHVGIEVVTHLTTRDRNLMALQSDLLGMHALGLRYVLAMTGDPPMTSTWAPATGVYDVDSIGLIRLIKSLNAGHDAGGTSIGQPTHFLVGCTLNPMAADLDVELQRFERKIEMGADFAVTQAAYDPELFACVLDRLGPLPIPLLLELMPLQSYKNAEFIHNELAGVYLPPDVLERMKAAGGDAADVGLDIARETFRALRNRINGVYIVPAFDRFSIAARLGSELHSEVASNQPC
jgi:homocysteine S-methyltransferase